MRSKINIPKFMLLLLSLFFSTEHYAQISIPNASFTDNQDFSTLASSGTGNTVVPTGWAFFETGTNANTTYDAGTGSNNAGNTYSFGLAGNSERAFGGLLSGSLVPTVGVCYTNNTGSAINGLTVTYTGETWRVGTASRTDGIQFQYNESTTAINGAGTWTSFPALDYFNPGQATGSGSMQHSALISSAITGLNIAPGATFCFRWNDFNATSSDDGIGVDDYSLSNIVVPPPCEVIGFTYNNISSCNDNGTPSDATDDYFTADVSVLYSNSTNGDSLILNGGDLVFRRTMLSQVGTNVTSTFTTVRFRADGQPVDFTGQIGSFSNIHCSLPGTGPAVNSCSNGPTPPVNDLCANAVTIPAVNANICGTTIGANADNPNGGIDCPAGEDADANGAGVWYTFQGTGQTWDFFFPQQGEDWDPEVNVYSGTCGSLTCVTGDDDGGGGLSAQFSINSVSGTTYYVYVHPADDFGGGTSDFCFDVTLSGTPPVILSCPTNQTEFSCLSQDTINAHFTTWLASASASGGCNGVLTNNNTGAPSVCGGSTTVTFTYTSQCEPFVTTCQATFSVAAPPTVVLTCPVNMTQGACLSQDTINARFNAWLMTASGTGGCNGVLSNNSTGAPSACGGSTTVTFTYTSSCAPTTTTCQATFTVTAPPTVILTCPINTTVASCQTQAGVNAQFAAWLATASASGGCNGVLSNNNQGAPLACGGSTTVTFTYTSACAPLTTTCSATFTVAASSTATLSCPAPTTVSACLTQAQVNTAYSAWLNSATVSGGCGGGTVTNNAPAAPLVCNPNSTTITVIFTYSGGACQTAPITCSSSFTLPAYPDFTVPANGASTVSCPSQIVQPTPPLVNNGCGSAITPTGPVIVNNPSPITCEGTRTYTWTYTDCAGHTKTWSHVVTVERQPFGVPANGGSTVACPDQTDTQPIPPVVTSNCGELLTPVITSTAKPGCEGNRNWNFTYTDCEGNTATWTYIYTVEFQDFTVPASETVNSECPLTVVVPTPPTVTDNCGKIIVPTGPVVVSTDNANGCEGSRSYTWTYKDCEGNTHTWSKTFNFGYTEDFFVYPDGEAFVSCLAYAEISPVPPVIYDACGREISFEGPFLTEDVDDSGCSGVRKFTFIYTDCGGHSHPWNFTYYANDNEPPVGNCSNAADVTNLDCIQDVPCPDDYDFSTKIQELLAAGDIHDVCSGDDLVVELDSWSALWECSDQNGDGINTFGRTFYFRIADLCGNEMPSLCSVTYSGKCLPLQTFTHTEWGNEGDAPSDATPTDSTDLQTIANLLSQGGALTIGGTNRSLTLTDAQCVLNLLPGVGNPTFLGNCQQTNCNGCNPAGPIGMKNSLATNTISLMLNMRFNVVYHHLLMNNIRNQSLGCIFIDPNIKTCADNGTCQLHVFEVDGTEHVFPYTIGGLLDLANLYLDGNLSFSVGAKLVYASAINSSVANVNAYWHNGGVNNSACNPDTGANAVADNDSNKAENVKPNVSSKQTFSLAPNPASNEVVLKLAELTEAQPVTFELYNQLGQLVLRKDFGNVSYVNERISLDGIGTGLYIVSVKTGAERHELKLIISKD